MLIATWNVNSLKARLPRVEEWLATVRPDVLCMQETKMTDTQFPAMTFSGLGYESVHHGQGQWNGVAILSRVGIENPASGFEDEAEADRDARLIWATCDGVRIGSVYVPNGREVGADHFVYKLEWLERLRANLEARYDPDEPLAISGDWNIAPADRDVWSVAAFEGSTHVTPEERTALADVKQWGLVDVFRERYGDDDQLFSYWDYRNGDFHKKRGMRIDYVLASRGLAKQSVSDLIDRNARKGTKPSDHAPVLALFDR
jgi:exodeoxyribonuclease-3